MKYFLTVLLLAFLTATLLPACQPAAEPGTLEWQGGWIRAMPPNSAMTAAYGELRNASDEDLSVISFESDSFADVSLHQSRNKNGMSGMQQVDNPSIAAGQALLLEPGGLHVMLMRPKHPLHAGDSVMITIHVASMGTSQSNQPSTTRSYDFVLLVEAK